MDPVESYARKELEKGFSKKEIYAKLISSGYKAEKIRPLLEKFPEESHSGNRKWVAIALMVFLVIGISLGAWHLLDFPRESSEKTTLLPEDYAFDKETGIIKVKGKYLEGSP